VVTVVAVLLLVGMWLEAGHSVGSATPTETPVVFAGVGSRTTEHFHLAGGTYHGLWSAWGQTPNDPPCTHSVELMAVDPANGTNATGHVIDLAALVHVPSTGASDETYVINVKPGEYYLGVTSACAWQVAFGPSR
jgi:hypothetical protein